MTIRSKEDDSAVSLRQARETGEAEANAADLRLLLEESLAREESWMTKALQAQKEIEEVRLSEQQRSLWRALNLEEQLENARAESAHLQAERDRLDGEVASLTDYRRSVEASKESWMTKALQAQKEIEEVRENARADSAHLQAERDRLDGEVAWLTDYRRAVERSKAWRLIQFFRGLVGRKW